jgi:hypothetical protein
MTKRRNLIVPAIVLALLFLALAGLYVAEPAKSLPAFIPGHESGSGHHHVKHGLAALVVALGCLAFAWFQSGPSQQRPA